ncbi:MAG: anaerobic ribonucleoside-triphosphate reductase activating protein [Campylobacterota bacterium]
MNKELNSLNQKIVYDFTRFTTIDYTGYLSCVVWLNGCNLRCKYCYNKELVFNKEANFSLNDILIFLKKRVGLLDAVVISGGEASLHNIISFCKRVKHLGFKIKLDTNLTNMKLIHKLLILNLIDYMAIDFKATKSKFNLVTKKNYYNIFIENLKFLISINFDFEIRTTLHKELLNENDINKMIKTLECINYKGIYYLQRFVDTDNNIGNLRDCKPFDKSLIKPKHLKIEWRD